MSIEESNQVKEDDRWSSLPTLLLWTIRYRLGYFNGVPFALVCKNWRDAYVSYPINYKDEFQVNNSPPWIMSYEDESRYSSTREFESLLTGERYTIDNPDFIDSEVLCSRQGWLLLLRLKEREDGYKRTDVDTKYESPYLLLNPFKNTTIKLPFLDITFRDAAFSIMDDNPHYVILKRTEDHEFPQIILYIAHPGDDTWLRYTYTCKIEGFSRRLWIPWVFIIGKLVYFISEKARVFVFNIMNSQWTDLTRESKQHSDLILRDEQYMVEKQGELLRFHLPKEVNNKDKDLRKANCYKLMIMNGENANWELIDGRILAHTCFWFLTGLFGYSTGFEIKKFGDLVALRKAFRKRNNRTKKKGIKTLAFSRYCNSKWVDMG